MKTARLGVNIDHVATVRQARGTVYPEPLRAALEAENAGCFSIVAHLREDRRHIQDVDVRILKNRLGKAKLNMEMSIAPDIVRIAQAIVPYQATLVPEKRKELTTEGGLDLATHSRVVGRVVEILRKKGVKVSVFIDPVKKQVQAAHAINADMIEFHTGEYANALTKRQRARELISLAKAAEYARVTGFTEIAAGHGLHYENIVPVSQIECITEYNIGHSIIAESIFIGITAAVQKMMRYIDQARRRA